MSRSSLIPVFDAMPWKSAGACVGMDPALFFPERGVPASEAKAACSSCPVKAECLQFALDNREKHGIWGGVSERQRRVLRRRIREDREQARRHLEADGFKRCTRCEDTKPVNQFHKVGDALRPDCADCRSTAQPRGFGA